MNTLTKVFFVFAFIAVSFSYAQQTTIQDTLVSKVALGKILLQNPNSIVSKYTYDPTMDKYVYTESIGGFSVNYPVILSPKEFQDLVFKEQIKQYFKDKADAISGKKKGSKDAQKNLLPSFYVNSNFFESIFGGNTIEVIPQGSVAMDLGIRYQKNDNPSLSPRNRSNLSFDFDQRISLSLLGKVGKRLQVMANYDTESTFDFQNLIKLEYTPTEDDIVRKIEVGNVSMPLNSALINGAQSLFGVKTQLQFGKTTITGVFSEQRSQNKSVVAQGGGTLNEFEFFALDYDEDRHFFMAQYFRDHYDKALKSYPYINSPIQITRVEVWVTNRMNRTQGVRNIVALQDLGEANPAKMGLSVSAGDITPGFFNTSDPGAYPDNGNNKLDPTQIGKTSVLTDAVRDIATIGQSFSGINVNEGFDYASLESARQLQEGVDFQINKQLGYISLRQRLTNDEVLGVAFQFTAGGKVYQVGEFASDGVNATEFAAGTLVNNQNLVVKLLKSNLTSVAEPVWDLMMKNIYNTGAYELSQEGFKMNVLYADPSPQNYITAAGSTALPANVVQKPLLQVFNLDKLNIYNDPQNGGDGFFDFIPGITVNPQQGQIIFTSVEPFGSYLYEKLGGGNQYDNPTAYNENQKKYVYQKMYTSTKAGALEDADKNKFLLKGRYKSEGGNGIPIGAFNVPRGSVKVKAGGRILQEGIDYTVNYQAGTVQILDKALEASSVPISVSVENNAVFGQQNRRFSGINIEHKFNDNFLIGGTFLNLKERPLTQKANYGLEPVNNSIFGFNANYATEVPFLTRMVNKLPNIDTDVASKVSLRGEFAYLMPGAPNSTDFDGESTVYIDDFEGSQVNIDVKSPLAWRLASAPINYGGELTNNDLQVGYNRAKLSWYTVDPIFYTSQRPAGITDSDVSKNETRRVFIDEIFPKVELSQGQSTIQTTLDLAYYPQEQGPYNANPSFSGVTDTQKWAGITRSLSSTNFEQSNVEYIQFWILDPFTDTQTTSNAGELVFNLGNISEDVLKDGKKQYENGLPAQGSTDITAPTSWGKVPATQSLVYAFDALASNRALQDVGLDGLNDFEEAAIYGTSNAQDPARDNYQFYVNATGGVVERYKNYNGTDGNSPTQVSNTNRGSTTMPDVEDLNRDQTMNTINSYYEYRVPIKPNTNRTDLYVNDIKEVTVTAADNSSVTARWIQYKIPITTPQARTAINGINDLRSVRFMRMYLTKFNKPVVLRFATLDLVRGDWRRYLKNIPVADPTFVDIKTVNIQENENRCPVPYKLPPGVAREQLNNNNTIVKQNEQSLSLTVDKLQQQDYRAIYKNVNFDMRQYKRMKMFLHAEKLRMSDGVSDGDLVAFIRLGTDLDQNYYQVEMPLDLTDISGFTTSGSCDMPTEQIWKNELEVSLDMFSKLKARVLTNSALSASGVHFFDEDLQALTLANEFDPTGLEPGKKYRYAVKGNPTTATVRTIMLGVKHVRSSRTISGEVWFNELRLAELDNKGGWAAISQFDANLADFATLSASGKISTIGFGSIDQRPNERSREESKEFDVVTNVNAGQLLPKKWHIQLPVNYSYSEQLVTPEFDPLYQDIRLKDNIEAAPTQKAKDSILRAAQDFTRRTSINFIGVRKDRAPEQKERFYDIENITLNYSYNTTSRRNFETEHYKDQSVKTGALYNYNFKPLSIAPFKKNDSILKSRYWKWLKDVNFNPLPTSVMVASNITRNFNAQRFRDVSTGNNIELPELQQRNFLFDWQYAVNYDITKSLRFSLAASNNYIVKNYFEKDGSGQEILNEDGYRVIDKDLGIWDGFWDIGDPNRHAQRMELNYELPFDKVPFLSFINANYTYGSNFDWQRGSDVLAEVTSTTGDRLGVVNTVQNSNTQSLNTSFNMKRLYKYLGLEKKRVLSSGRSTANKGKKASKKHTMHNTLVGLLTSVKRMQFNYSENRGKVLPGYLPSIGFVGTLKPTVGFIFGSQADVRFKAAQRGWLTQFSEFNQQYMERIQRQLTASVNIEPTKGLKIDLTANRQYDENYTENFSVTNTAGDLSYNALTPNRFGNFDISTVLIKTAFTASTQEYSKTFSEFQQNRKVIATRLADGFYGSGNYTLDANGYPKGFGKNNQSVLLPAFLAAYSGQDASKTSLKAFKNIPLPNWNIKYTGLMQNKWFKKKFKRFSLTHGYRASYSLNAFRSNLDYTKADGALSYENQDAAAIDQAGNYKNQTVFSSVNLVEQFNPLIKLDFEMKNAISIMAEVKKERTLSLSFDNDLLTELNGKEYILGLGYRIKDLRFVTNFGGKKTTLKGDLNLKADLSLRDNITVIRNLEITNNQVTAGQTIWGLKFTADYSLTKNLSTQFFYDHTFSKFAVSTAFPQTTIRSGFTLRYNFGN